MLWLLKSLQVADIWTYLPSNTIDFYRAAYNADAVYSDEKDVRLSVFLSVRLSNA